MNKGWIKLHRGIMDKPIWTESTPEQKVVLITLLMMANHSEKQWEWRGKPFTARPGQFVTSLPNLAQKCVKNCSVQKIRTALKRFERYGFLTDESTAHNRLITLVNWGVYQGGTEIATAESTDDQQTANRHLTANKNVKNEENEKKSNRRKQVYDESSIFYQLALAQFEEIQMNQPHAKEPNFQKWANDFRLIVERDDRTVEQITYLMKWAMGHSFWHSVILSPSSLRRHWDRLVAQMKQERALANEKVVSIPKKQIQEFSLDLTKGESI